MVNVNIYSIHGSYGIACVFFASKHASKSRHSCRHRRCASVPCVAGSRFQHGTNGETHGPPVLEAHGMDSKDHPVLLRSCKIRRILY